MDAGVIEELDGEAGFREDEVVAIAVEVGDGGESEGEVGG